MALFHGGADDLGLVGRTIDGGFLITARARSTPQGPLYEAEDPKGRRVGLLILSPRVPGQEPANVRSLRLAATIQHPNVAAVHAVGELEDGSIYVVLDEPIAESLQSVVSARSVLPIGEALELMLQVVSGLEAVHRVGFVHGNVSPYTIVVTRPPFGKSQVKLVGFDPNTDLRHETKLDAGSAPYASPERLAGSLPDVRYDVFSVGAVLHHLLSGGPPIPGQGVGDVPAIARPVLKKALARLPAERFQRMSELREALEALATAAVTAPEVLRYRKVLIGAVGAGVVLAAGGLLLGPVWSSLAVNWSRTESSSSRTQPAAVTSRDSSIRAESSGGTRAPATRGVERAGGKAALREARRKTAAAGPTAVEAERNGAVVHRTESPGALGYVGQSGNGDDSADAPPREPPSPPLVKSPVAPDRTAAPTPPRSLAVLQQDPGLRQAMADVTRIGLARQIVEARPGLLVVELAPDGMGVPSASYNLQRLYLAYSAVTRQQHAITLELRQNGAAYGWFTRDGLREAPLPTTPEPSPR